MTAPRDPDRLIDLFLAEGLEELPVRSYDAVRSDIDRIRQRVVFIDPWRTIRMNSYAKLAIAAAAIVVIAIAGLRFLPDRNGPGAPTPTPAPSVVELPSAGKLSVGRYAASAAGIRWTFSLTTADWFSQGGDSPMLTTGSQWTYQPGGGMISFTVEALNARHGGYPDPCDHDNPGPVAGPSLTEQAAAAAALPDATVTGPDDVAVAGLPAKHVVAVLDDPLPCTPNSYWLGYGGSPGDCDRPEGCMRWVTDAGSTEHYWILEVAGKRMWIEAETYHTATEARIAEVNAIVASIQFE